MSLGETILAIFGTRKLSTSKDYRLLKKNIETLYENDRVLRDMVWTSMTDEQKEKFRQKYEERKAQQRTRGEYKDDEDDLERLVKKGFWIIVGIFGGLFVLYMIVYTIVAACT